MCVYLLHVEDPNMQNITKEDILGGKDILAGLPGFKG